MQNGSDKKIDFEQNIWSVLIWGSAALFTVLYITLLFNQNVWTDEIFTLKLIEKNFLGIVEGTIQDVHPPLYYFIARIARLLFGEALIVQKALALAAMSLTLVLGAVKVRRLFSDRVSFLFIVILGCIPCSMEFAVQVRMYSMALLAVTACGLYAYECYMTDGKRPWFGLVISAVAAAYLHYYALGSVMVICGLLFLALVVSRRKKLKTWLLSIAVMIISYLAWIRPFAYQISGVARSYWIPEITKETILEYFQWTFGISKWNWPCYLFILLSIAAGIVVLVGGGYRRGEDIFALLCMLVPTLTAVAGVALSFLIRPIYRDQYIFRPLAYSVCFWRLLCPALCAGSIAMSPHRSFCSCSSWARCSIWRIGGRNTEARWSIRRLPSGMKT